MRLRTIPQYVAEARKKDNFTAVSSSMIRRLVTDGKVKAVSIGSKMVINADVMDCYLLGSTQIRYTMPEMILIQGQGEAL